MDRRHKQIAKTSKGLGYDLEWHMAVIAVLKKRIAEIQAICSHPEDEMKQLPGDPAVDGEAVEEYKCKVCGAIITMKGKMATDLVDALGPDNPISTNE